LVVERLGLARPFKQVAEYADGRREEVGTEPVFVELLGRHTVEEALVLGDGVIVEQTILEKPTSFDCRQKRLLPNPYLTNRSYRSNEVSRTAYDRSHD
jgi:hypothetical protein